MITKKHLFLHVCVYCTFIIPVVIYTTGVSLCRVHAAFGTRQCAFLSPTALCAPLIFAHTCTLGVLKSFKIILIIYLETEKLLRPRDPFHFISESRRNIPSVPLLNAPRLPKPPQAHQTTKI